VVQSIVTKLDKRGLLLLLLFFLAHWYFIPRGVNIKQSEVNVWNG